MDCNRRNINDQENIADNDQEIIADNEQENIADDKERTTTDGHSTKSEDGVYLEVESYLRSGQYPSGISKQEKAVIRKNFSNRGRHSP